MCTCGPRHAPPWLAVEGAPCDCTEPIVTGSQPESTLLRCGAADTGWNDMEVDVQQQALPDAFEHSLMRQVNELAVH